MRELREYNDYIQTTKNYLKRYSQFKATVSNKREQIELLKLELTNEEADINAPIAQYGEKVGHGTPELNGVESAAARYEGIEKKIKRLQVEIKRLEHICNMIANSLQMLPVKDRKLIECYYFQHMSWREIADIDYITEKWAAEKGARAVREIAGMLFGKTIGDQQDLFVFALKDCG